MNDLESKFNKLSEEEIARRTANNPIRPILQIFIKRVDEYNKKTQPEDLNPKQNTTK